MTVGERSHIRVKNQSGCRVLITTISVPSSLSFYLAGRGTLIWVQVVRAQNREPGAGVAVAVLAACAGLDNVFHSPTSVSWAGEELRFPVLQTNK